MRILPSLFFCILISVFLSWQSNAIASSPIDETAPAQMYLDQIKPLLKSRCYSCHGALKQEGGLRLDAVRLMEQGGSSGPAVVRGNREAGVLLERIASQDVDLRMPQEGEPLTDEQVELIAEWIDSGSPGPENETVESDPRDHWAFRKVTKPTIPIDSSGWSNTALDAFITDSYRKHDLVPHAMADELTLVRRVFIDLIGVPPTFHERASINFDDSQWYELLVDRLLNDPRHGERWGRHWMDVWRYSDWWGLGDQLRNSQPHIWHWRDWIIESVNSDMPYDEMIRQMLAADEIYPSDLDKIRATGYLARNYFLFNRNQWMEDTVEHVGKSFLGITMNCAKCHDHKFDPIDHADYYRLRAFFEPYHVRLDMLPGEVDLTRNAIPRVYDGLLDTPTYLFRRGEESQPVKDHPIEPGIPAILAFKQLKPIPIELPLEAWRPELRAWVQENYLCAARVELERAELACSELQSQQNSSVLPESVQGNARLQPNARPQGESELQWAMACAVVEFARANLERIEARGTQTSVVLAQRRCKFWETRKQTIALQIKLLKTDANERAAVEEQLNKLREQLVQLESTLEATVRPDELMEPLVGAKWTPTRFLNSTVDDPTVVFPATSTGRRRALAEWITDSANPLTARVAVNHIWNRHLGTPLVSTVFDFGRNGSRPTHPEMLDWLAAELIESNWSMKHIHRVIVNSATYRLASSNQGHEQSALKDPDNQFWWRRNPIRMESQVVRDSILQLAGQLDCTMNGPSVSATEQEESTRRSIYFFHSNNDRNMFLSIFDEARVKECYRRDQSIVPQQALAMANSRLVYQTAPKIAAQCGSENLGEEQFIRESFATILAAEPSEEEMGACRTALHGWSTMAGSSREKSRHLLIWTLLNHNDFVTIR